MIKVGKTYATRNNEPYTCIAVDDKYAYMHGYKGRPAYVWLIESGHSISLGYEYNLEVGICFKEVDQ